MLQIGLSEIKYIEARVQTSSEYISLSQGALRVGGIPKEVKTYLQEVFNTDKTDYYQSAWGIMPLREKIARKLSERYDCSFSEKNILVTHGCMGALSSILLTILEKGDEVILPEPTYPAYEKIVSVARAKSVFVSCLKNNIEWELDIEKIKFAKTSKTKVVLFSNPCNPSGAMVSKSKLEELVNWCEENSVYLIVDEAYEDYVFEEQFESITPFVLKSKFVIRTGSYSKSLSMSGWRIGFMVVSESLSRVIGIAQDALSNCPNVIAQYAVLYAIDHPEFVRKFHNRIEQNLNLSVTMLQPLVEQKVISYKKPPAGFYLFLKTKERDSFDLCMSILNNVKVGLIPGRAFGPSGDSFIRLCYARTQDVLKEGINRILKYFG